MTDAQRIDALRGSLGGLNDKARGFADSLLGYWERRGTLSDKQWAWVEKLSKGTHKQESKKKTAPKAKSDARFESMLSAFRGANAGQRKRLMKAIHPDLWDNAPWATELFKAANP
jgi:hypothetical protein